MFIHDTETGTPMYFKAGEKMELICQQSATAEIAKWFKGTENMENSDTGFTVVRAKKEIGGEQVRLNTLIKNIVEKSDEGQYSCKADSTLHVDITIFSCKYYLF